MFRNKKYLLAGAAFGLTCAISAQAQAQGPDRQPQPRVVLLALDTNHDGKLSQGELAAAPVSLLTLDSNGDGEITSDELSQRPSEAGAAAPIAPDALTAQLMAFDKTGKGFLVPADVPERMQGLFTRADANHDGQLTPQEIGALSSRQGMPLGGAPQPGKAAGIFRMDPLLNAIDTNHDGMISADEIAASGKDLLFLDKNGDGEITSDEMRPRQQTPEERIDHMLGEWDTNGDGKLSKAEAPERMAAQFDQLDTNHDGFLDKDELLANARNQGSQQRPRGNNATPDHQ